MKLFQTNIEKDDIEKYIAPILESGNIGFGSNVEQFEKDFSDFSRKKFNIATNSASGAAFMIFSYLYERYGNCDVYTPSIGFTSPAWAAKHFGHNIIWVEVDENLLFDISDYKEKRRWRCERYTDGGVRPVIMPILYGGVSTIKGLADLKEDGYNETIIVDSAHCVTPRVCSDFLFFSFHPYKPVAASDGGLIGTDDREAADYFYSYRNFGRRNTESGYNVEQEGFKFYMNNLNATIAITQLNKYTHNLDKRRETLELIKELNLQGRLLVHDQYSSLYFATVIADSNKIQELEAKYNTSKHYPLLHKSSYFDDGTQLPFTEEIHKYIVNLPLYDKDIYNS